MNKILFLLFLLCLPAHAASDAVLVSKDGITRLFDRPCTNAAVLERVLVVHQAELRAGTLTFETRLLEACWVSGKRMVFVIDSEGDLSRIPIDNFVPADGI